MFVQTLTAALLWGHDRESFVTRKTFRGGGIASRDDGNEASQINFLPFGYVPLQPQPNHPRPERAAAIMPIEGGIENTFTFVAVPIIWPYDPQAFQPPHPKPERDGSILRGEDGTESQLINFFQFAWPIAPHQPQHPRSEKWASLIPGDPGNEAPVYFQPYGWDPVLHPPEHPRPERAGAIMPFEPGIEAQFVFVIQAVTWPYELQSWQPEHVRWERAGAIARGDDGTESTFAAFHPAGWEIAPYQPQHVRFERFASLIGGDAGTEAPLIRFFPDGWEAITHQPQHPRPERYGSLVFGEVGIEATFIAPLPAPLLWGHLFQETELIRSTWRNGAILAEYGFFFPVPPPPIPPIPPIPPPPPRPVYKPPYKFGTYQVDTLLQLNVTFYDTSRNVPADPLVVTIFVQDPLGNITQLPSEAFPDSQIVRTGTGTYYCDFLPSMPGEWKYKWQGTTNGVIATTPDTRFFVKGSELLN